MQSERDSLVSLHEFSVGRGVAALRAFDQLGFVQWPVHHRRFYTHARANVPGQPERRALGCRWDLALGVGRRRVLVRGLRRLTACREQRRRAFSAFFSALSARFSLTARSRFIFAIVWRFFELDAIHAPLGVPPTVRRPDAEPLLRGRGR